MAEGKAKDAHGGIIRFYEKPAGNRINKKHVSNRLYDIPGSSWRYLSA
jgi:hypothetical protein